MAHANLDEVLGALRNVDFPAIKDELLRAAQASGASSEVLTALRAIPPEELAAAVCHRGSTSPRFRRARETGRRGDRCAHGGLAHAGSASRRSSRRDRSSCISGGGSIPRRCSGSPRIPGRWEVTGPMASRWLHRLGWPGSNLTSIVVLMRAVTVAPPRGDGTAGWSSLASRECGAAEGRPIAGGAQACANDLRNSCRRDWMPSLRNTLRRW